MPPLRVAGTGALPLGGEEGETGAHSAGRGEKAENRCSLAGTVGHWYPSAGRVGAGAPSAGREAGKGDGIGSVSAGGGGKGEGPRLVSPPREEKIRKGAPFAGRGEKGRDVWPFRGALGKGPGQHRARPQAPLRD